MSSNRGVFAGVLALLAGTASCASPSETGGEAGGTENAIPLAALEATVDRVDVLHGALRVRIAIPEGGAGAWMALGAGEDCAGRSLGGGMSTRSGLVWTFGEAELTEALACGLQLFASIRTETGYVTKALSLPVAVDLVPAEGEPPEGSYELASAGGPPSGSDVPAADLARAVIGGGEVLVDGRACEASVSVGGTSLDADSSASTSSPDSQGAQDSQDLRERE